MNNGIKFLSALLVGEILVLVVQKKFNQELLSPISEFISPTVSYFSENFTLGVTSERPQDSLEDVVQNALEGTNGSYAVVVINLKTGESYSLNEHKEFEPGS